MRELVKLRRWDAVREFHGLFCKQFLYMVFCGHRRLLPALLLPRVEEERDLHEAVVIGPFL